MGSLLGQPTVVTCILVIYNTYHLSFPPSHHVHLLFVLC